jgi:hypothetical protein
LPKLRPAKPGEVKQVLENWDSNVSAKAVATLFFTTRTAGGQLFPCTKAKTWEKVY